MAEMTVTPEVLEKAFSEKNIVPNIIKVAPKKKLNVNSTPISIICKYSKNTSNIVYIFGLFV